jgi:hypothetical protein
MLSIKRSVVVPGISLTGDKSLFKTLLKKVDLPTLGLPTIARVITPDDILSINLLLLTEKSD